MVIDSAEYGGDYKMRFYNADGSFGEMCGNGARCIAVSDMKTVLPAKYSRSKLSRRNGNGISM